MDSDPATASNGQSEARPKSRAAKSRTPKSRDPNAHPDIGPERGVREKRINLALQGGGAHGAFTWGVCDKLLEDGRIEIEGISGTSAGAMNAAVLAAGHATGGNEGARAALDRFWRRVGEAGRFGPLQPTWLDRMLGHWGLDNSPAYAWFDMMSRLFSPYQLAPWVENPLKPILEDTIDFDALRHATTVKIYISATNVRTGKVRVFRTFEMTSDVLCASACLPFMFRAVEIEGEHYWDGGYMGNPAIFPLIYHSATNDVVIVQINPLERDEVPTTARGIMDRVNEISFNSTLMREMRAVHFVTKLIESGKLNPEEYRRMNVHMIEADAVIKTLGASSKLNATPEFLLHLRNVGRKAAGDWIDRNFDALGARSTVDLVETYL